MSAVADAPSLGQSVLRFLGAIAEVWNLELWSFDGATLTIGKSVVAVVLLTFGLLIAGRMSRALGRLLVQRLKLEEGAAHAFERVGFYALVVAVVLFSLRIVNFPLTVFTILGGALAIGIGFGSQNVMNNFISGLILLVERPIRAGDLVELQGTYGTIERIGGRSTRMRAADNTQVIVPNSFFLENNLVNWTLSDDVVRARVDVGVAYGSPTREIVEILREVIDGIPEILQRPEPVILLAGFGESSLCFECYFWVRTRTLMNLRRIESLVRYGIDDRFREAGIVIAFPQRDLHIETARPLEVRLLPERPEERA